MHALSNKVAIVTGASSGIGRATALLFAREGAKVVVTARRRAELEALVAEIARSGGHAVALAGDVTEEAHSHALVELALGRFGGLDVAFDNAASKAGLIGLTQALAAEFGPQGVRVNALLPGGTDTPAFRAMNASEEARTFVAGMHSLKRVASPDEIARTALYLASDASSFTTGTALLADGGVSIQRT